MTGFIFYIMKLVKLNNFRLEVEDELLLLKPFKALYDSDKTKDKSKFMDFLTIVYFVYDPRSDYSYISDEKERLEEVCSTNGFKSFNPSKKETEAIELYKSLTTTTSSQLLQDTKITVDKLRRFLLEVDLNLLDDKGKPVYTINSITSTIKQIPQLAKDLIETEKIVNKEIQESGRARGSAAKTIFEDGIMI